MRITEKEDHDNLVLKQRREKGSSFSICPMDVVSSSEHAPEERHQRVIWVGNSFPQAGLLAIRISNFTPTHIITHSLTHRVKYMNTVYESDERRDSEHSPEHSQARECLPSEQLATIRLDRHTVENRHTPSIGLGSFHFGKIQCRKWRPYARGCRNALGEMLYLRRWWSV